MRFRAYRHSFMNMSIHSRIVGDNFMRALANLLIVALLFAVQLTAAQTVQDTAFTYQGELLQNNVPVTASVDMVFTLYDAPTSGNVIGAPITLSAADGDPVQVVDGLFTVSLDFGGAAFITTVNDARWLAVSVDGNALSPRTKIENAPYALTAQLAYGVVAGSIGTAQINAAQVQRRVSGTCASGSSISVINQDGSVSCQSAGSGTITGVTPASGSGITGGGTSGSVSIDTDLTVLQKRVGSVCASGQAIRVVNADGTVACQAVGSTFTLPYSATQSNAGPLFNVTNTDTSSASTALQGISNSTAAAVSAVEGVISSTSPGSFSAGVRGINNSTTGNGFGVYGSTAGSGAGVAGSSISGAGVIGSSGSSYAGYFVGSAGNNADTLHVDTSTIANGVHSVALLRGVFGEATSIGVQGNGQTGVYGLAPVGAFPGRGVSGISLDTTAEDEFSTPFTSNAVGVYGQAAAPSGVGVYGVALDATGGSSGTLSDIGVYGQANGPYGVGMFGFSSGNFGAAVTGIAQGFGAIGVSAIADNSVGLYAEGINSAILRGPAFINGGALSINGTAPNPDIELEVSSNNPSNPNADILLQPYGGNFGIDLSVGGTSTSNLTFCICQTPDGSAYTQFLGLDASGNLAIHGGTATKPGGGAWSAPSDIRLKRDVQTLDHVLDKLLQLRGVTFEYANPDGGLHPSGRHTGFIAQEVQQVFPDWIGQTPDGYLTVGAKGFEALTVEALRELRAEKDAEIDSLHAQLDELGARLNRLENAPETRQ